MVEVTCRTIQGRMLLRSSRELKLRIVGVLARAAACYEVGVCTFTYLSNHCHLLLRPPSATALAAFMTYLNSNIAREAGRLYGWREKFWGRPLADENGNIGAVEYTHWAVRIQNYSFWEASYGIFAICGNVVQ